MKCIIGFKGKNNASYVLSNYLNESPYLLTNSFVGLKNDIELLNDNFDYVLMFGVDKNLKDSVRIESVAEKDNCRVVSRLDLNIILKRLKVEGIESSLSDKPTHYLCNEAYWYALRKFNGKVVFIHIPSLKNINQEFLDKMKLALGQIPSCRDELICLTDRKFQICTKAEED